MNGLPWVKHKHAVWCCSGCMRRRVPTHCQRTRWLQLVHLQFLRTLRAPKATCTRRLAQPCRAQSECAVNQGMTSTWCAAALPCPALCAAEHCLVSCLDVLQYSQREPRLAGNTAAASCIHEQQMDAYAAEAVLTCTCCWRCCACWAPYIRCKQAELSRCQNYQNVLSLCLHRSGCCCAHRGEVRDGAARFGVARSRHLSAATQHSNRRLGPDRAYRTPAPSSSFRLVPCRIQLTPLLLAFHALPLLPLLLLLRRGVTQRACCQRRQVLGCVAAVPRQQPHVGPPLLTLLLLFLLVVLLHLCRFAQPCSLCSPPDITRLWYLVELGSFPGSIWP